MPMAMVGLLTALPRTALRDRLEREGRLLAQSTSNNTHSATLNSRTVQPEGSAPGRLLPRPRRDLPSTRLLRPLPRVPSALPDWRRRRRSGEAKAVTPRNLLYLLRSLFIQGFSRYGAEYFRFVLKAFRIGPGLVETFITFAVQGRHFFIITRRFLRGRPAALEAAANLGKSVPLAT